MIKLDIPERPTMILVGQIVDSDGDADVVVSIYETTGFASDSAPGEAVLFVRGFAVLHRFAAMPGVEQHVHHSGGFVDSLDAAWQAAEGVYEQLLDARQFVFAAVEEAKRSRRIKGPIQ